MAAIPFALAPALVNDGIIDFSTVEGTKLYQAAIEPLPGDPFNCEAHGVKVFLANSHLLWLGQYPHRSRRC